MTVSEKQLQANKANAQKGGVKTAEGKEIVKYNALKHGLLAKEIVITVGDGAENPEEFNVLLEDLNTQLKPEGTLEDILVEKIAVAYWRLRRAYKYEVGLIRDELDNTTDDYYGNTDLDGKKYHKTNEEIERQIEEDREEIEQWEKNKGDLSQMYKAGKSLEEIYDREDSWDWLCDRVKYILPDDEDKIWQPKDIREFLSGDKKWSDDDIWQALIEICDERVKCNEEEIATLKQDKVKNQLRLQVIKKLGNVPSRDELDRLLRYEGAIERQFYKAMNQLERLQRMRSGESVPAPIEVDVGVDTGQNG